MTCRIDSAPGQEALLVTVAGELDLAQAPELAATLRAAVETGDDVVVDLRDVGFIDSSGLRTIMRAASLAGRHGRRMEVRPSRAVDRLFELAGGWRIAPRAMRRATRTRDHARA